MRALNNDKSSSLGRGERASRGGFTFIELLVVIFVIALLAARLAPAMASSGTDSAAAKCMSNQRQLTAGWQMYADENRGVFAYNESGGNPPAWVYGNEDYSGASYNYNTNYLLNPQYAQLGPYVKTATVFKCPSDLSLSGGTHGIPRVRSISMNAAVGLGAGGLSSEQGAWLPSNYGNDGVEGGPYVCFFKQQDLGRPAPSALFLFLEEDADSINDGSFAFTMPEAAAETHWVDMPAKYHANANNFSFIDGHVELHAWRVPQGIPNVAWSGSWSSPPIISSNPDVWWVGTHVSGLVNGHPNPFPAGN